MDTLGELDYSDAATGLPSLDKIEESSAMLVLVWQVGLEGLISAPEDESLAVRYLSVRGLMANEDGDAGAHWAQVHLAFPVATLRSLLLTWLDSLDAQEDTPPGTLE